MAEPEGTCDAGWFRRPSLPSISTGGKGFRSPPPPATDPLDLMSPNLLDRLCWSPSSFARVACLWFLTAALGFAQTSAGTAAAAPRTRAERRPANILFLFSDDHATGAIGAYGSQIIETPRIDQLARQGALFTNSFCANSLCGPSRACILTGKHSHVNGFRRNGQRFDGQQWTFPPVLHASGYQTALIGKWHLDSDPVGFDHWQILPGQGNYYNPDLLQMDGTRKRYQGYCTDIVTDLALDWLKSERDPERPFLLMCQHKAPHRNWTPAPRHLGVYDGVTIPEPPSLFDDYGGRTALLRENEMSLAKNFHWGHDAKFHGENQLPEFFEGQYGNSEYERMDEAQKAAWDAHYEPENERFLAAVAAGELDEHAITSWKYQRYIKDYLACIRAVDENVGRMLDYLDESGLAENTLVIYSSDQGFYLGEHGWYDKRWIFEESLQMPFLIRWPGVIPEGTRSEALIQNIDYAPTFLEVAGLEVPPEVQGRSLLPLFENAGRAPADWRDAIYYAYYENAAVHNVPEHDGLRTLTHKLAFFPRTNEWQLFDLERDPQEMHSLQAQPEQRALLAGLQKRLFDLRHFYGVNKAVIPATRADEAWWRERFQAQNAATSGSDAKLLFVGDSITQGWEGAGREVWDEFYGARQALNLGISGDRTEHVLWRLEHGRLHEIEARVAVVMIGTNNTGHSMQDPLEIAEGVRAVLAGLRAKSPATHVLLLGIFPRGRDANDLGRLNNLAVNQLLRRMAGPGVSYLDIGDAFLSADGGLSVEIMPDALHLSPAGYRLWAQAIEAKLIELGV